MIGPPVRKALTIAVSMLRRFWRDGASLIFSIVFPLALIMMIGLQFGGDPPARLGVAGGDAAIATAVLAEVDDAIDVEVVEIDLGAATDRVRDGDVDLAVTFPDDVDAAVAAGRAVEVEVVVGRGDPSASRVRRVLDDAVLRSTAVPTAAHVAAGLGASRSDAADAAERSSDVLDRLAVEVVTTGDQAFPDGVTGADVGAPGQLVLFVILTGMAGANILIEDRRDGLLARMASTPTGSATIITGLVLGRFLIGLVQGLVILVVSTLVFDVDWGDPLAAAAVVVMVAAVGAGAGMCVGAFFDHPEQAGGVGVVVGMALAAIGGAMLPIELFGDTMATVARLTPHFWAIDAFAELIRHGGRLPDVGTDLVVLAAWAAGLVALATWRLRRSSVSG